MADPIQLVDPKTGEIFEAADDGMAERQMHAYGLQRAQPEQVQSYDEQQRSTGFVDKAKTFGETVVGQGAELIDAASQAGIGTQVDELSGETYGGGHVKAETVAPFVYTPQAKERRRANEGVATAATIATDIATGALIPALGVPGAIGSAVASGFLTEAGSTLILDDEYSLKDAAIAAGAGLAFEGAGALAFKGAMVAKGKVSNYLDHAVERARKVAAAGAEAETDATRAASALHRNSEELYTKHQTTLDDALGAIDERTAGAPDRMFTPGALKKTVSQNYAAQEEAFLDMAVKFDQAAQVAEVPGLADVAQTMQSALGKNGANMYDAMRTAQRQLDALGKLDNPLVREAAEALESSLRHEPTWGRAAKNYADVSQDATAAATDTVSVNLREANARELLDQRLDRARRMASLTNDQKLKTAIKTAEDALEGADKVTGARVMAEITPDDIKTLQKKVDGFADRAPKLGKELHGSYGKLNKILDGALGEMTEDGALDYVAARASGVGAKVDPLRDLLVKAEKKIADMKVKGADPTKVARATSALKNLREAVGEIHDIPRAAQRIRDFQARPQPGGLLGKAARKVGEFGDDVAVDEIANAIQPMLHGGGMTIGAHLGGIPGAIGGYLGGRAINKAFGERIARWVWKRGKKGAVEFAKKNPLEAAGTVVGGAAGTFFGPHGMKAGAIAGNRAGAALRKGARRAWKRAERVVEEAPAATPLGTPLGKAAEKAAPAAAKAESVGVRVTATARKGAPADVSLDAATALNMAQSRLERTLRTGSAEAQAAAKKAYEAALEAVKRDPVKTAGAAALVGAAALGADDKQTEGASAASAGLLLLLLPRNMGRRAAFEAFEHKAAQLARAVNRSELPAVRAALEAARTANRSVLREAASPGVTHWTPDELLDWQTREVAQTFREANQSVRHGSNPAGRMSDEAEQYARAELARQNAGWVNGDGALRRAYDDASREAELAERAAQGHNPSPRAQLLDRTSDMRPEAAPRLREDAINAANRLRGPDAESTSDVFHEAQDEIRDLARRFARSEPLDTGEVLQSADDLLRVQTEALTEHWRRLGHDAPIDGAAVRDAGLAELRRINAEAAVATRAALPRSVGAEARATARERWGTTPEVHTRTGAREVDPDRLARAQERVAELGGDGAPELYASQTREAWRQLPTSLQTPVRAGLAAERGTLAEMARRYVNGSPGAADAPLIRSAEQLFDEQVAHLRRRFAEDGRHIGAHYQPAVEAAVEAEVRRLNAQVADMTRTEHLLQNPKPTPGAEEFSSAPNSPEARATWQRPRGVVDRGPASEAQERALLERFAPDDWHRLNSAADDARTALHREGWRREEYQALDNAFEGVDRQLNDMLQSHARDGEHHTPIGRTSVETEPQLITAQREIVRRRLAHEARSLLEDSSTAGLIDDAIDARLRVLNARNAEGLIAQRGQAAALAARDPQLMAGVNRALDEMLGHGGPVNMHQLSDFISPRHLGGEATDADITRAMDLIHENRQALQTRADTHWREAEVARIERRERTLKHSNENPDNLPAAVDGLPTEAAFRLDKALLEPLEDMGNRYDNLGVVADDVMATEMLPKIEEVARKFIADNPHIADEEAILGYARRRHEELAKELRSGTDGPVWHALEDEGGHARWAVLEEPEDATILDRISELAGDQADEAYHERNPSLETDALIRSYEHLHDVNSRESRRLRELLEQEEDRLNRNFERRVEDNRRQYEEENPDSEAPDSDEDPDSSPPSSEREEYRSAGARYSRGEEDGLPGNEELRAIGLNRLEVNSNHGVENVFGRDLTTDEVKGIFSLEHMRSYAEQAGESHSTSIEVGRNHVEFQGRAGEFEIESTFRAGDDGLDIHYGLMRIPPEEQGTGMAKGVIRDMVAPIESLGGGKARVSTAWLGKYAWLKLGLEPSAFATGTALKEYRSDLKRILGDAHPAVDMSMARIQNTQHLADAYLPKELVTEKLPELRQAWEEKRLNWQGQRVELQPFEEGAFRTSRSGNEQFLSGKYFLVMREGPWNSDLTLRIKPGDAVYEEFKRRIGIGAGVVGLGLGLHELNAAFTGTDMHVSGIGGERQDDTPPEVTTALAEHAERFEKVERTREKLGYLKTESELIARNAARAIANPNPRERIVASIPGVTGSQGIAAFLGSNATLQEAYDSKRQVFQRLTQDPMLLVNELTEGLSEVQDHAPDLHKKMVQQSYKVVQFLQGKLPSTIGSSLTRPDGSPPNALAVRQFALYFSAATDPSSVMGDLANNRARKEQVDTLREVWPDVYQDLKVKVVEQLAQGRPTVAQRSRLDLLFDLGENLDRGLSPRLVQTLAAYRAQQGGPGGKGPEKGGQVPSRRTQPSVSGTGALGSLALGPGAGPGAVG